MPGPVKAKPVAPPEPPVAVKPVAAAPADKQASETEPVAAGDRVVKQPQGKAAPSLPLGDPGERRFVMGLRFGEVQPWLGGPAYGMSSLWLGGLFAMAGDPQATHTAMLYEGSMGLGGKSERGGMALEMGASVRQTFSVAPGGWQLFGQGGAVGNYVVVADDSFRQGSVSRFGIGARGQVGLAVPVGDMGWRLELGPFAEFGTAKSEMGLTIGFNGS